MQVASIRPLTAVAPPAGNFPAAEVDRARGLLQETRLLVKGMLGTRSFGRLEQVRSHAMEAAALIATATKPDTLFSRQMSEAVHHALDGAYAVAKAIDALRLIDNDRAPAFAFDALQSANKSFDRAYAKAMTGTHE